MTLGQQIKKIRMEQDLSQPMLAEAIGIEQSYLSKLENDKSIPSNDIFRKLLSGLGLSIEQLLEKLERSYIVAELCQIPDVEHWLSKKQHSQQKFSRRLLLLSSALIAFATTFFYVGFSQVLFSTTQHEYFSEGIIKQGEPFDYFESGAFFSAHPDDHEKVRHEVRQRRNPSEIKTFDLQGSSFMLDVEGGKRRYVYARDSDVTRIENGILQIAGVFMFACGILGFVLERRFVQLNRDV